MLALAVPPSAFAVMAMIGRCGVAGLARASGGSRCSRRAPASGSPSARSRTESCASPRMRSRPPCEALRTSTRARSSSSCDQLVHGVVLDQQHLGRPAAMPPGLQAGPLVGARVAVLRAERPSAAAGWTPCPASAPEPSRAPAPSPNIDAPLRCNAIAVLRMPARSASFARTVRPRRPLVAAARRRSSASCVFSTVVTRRPQFGSSMLGGSRMRALW